MTEPEYDRLLARARRTNANRDRDEQRNGWANPDSNGWFDWVEIAALAIEAGLRRGDVHALFEGLVMLQDCLTSYRPPLADT